MVLQKIKNSENLSIITNQTIASGEKIIQFKGALFDISSVANETLLTPADDRYIQIGPTTLMGPSGEFDDYINHSCEPNSGVRKINNEWWLVAIKNIEVGQEITWDYSTTMYNDDWQMNCDCKAAHCRKIIKEYKTLPNKIKKKYEMLGIVPEYNMTVIL